MQLPDSVRDTAELRDQPAVFFDRRHGAEKLASLMQSELGASAVVLGVACGGVPVANVVAERLGLPLDAVVVGKVTLPWNAEASFGAVAFDGTVRLNEELIDRLALTEQQCEEAVERTRAKIDRRLGLLRPELAPLHLDGERAIVVDDGIASGLTVRVAVDALRHVGAGEVVLASPTGNLKALQKLAEEVKRIYCVNVRGGHPFAVSDAYQNWREVSEAEAAAILRREPGRRAELGF